ncbi:MAG TPA: YigZ family protein [Limnochordia bacterium]|nr:YigZ family protein [Limnochordia bacterium]
MERRMLIARGSAELEIKRSRFIAVAAPVASAAEAKRLIASLRAEHSAASHVCSAYRVPAQGEEPLAVRFDDDGEPKGTAGRPILEVLEREDVWRAAIAVVRYFGGTLLGASGLVRAYAGAAAAALGAAGIGREQVIVELHVHVPYGLWDRFAHAYAERLAGVSPNYGADVELTLAVPADELAALQQELADFGAGTLRLRVGGRKMQAVVEDSPK